MSSICLAAGLRPDHRSHRRELEWKKDLYAKILPFVGPKLYWQAILLAYLSIAWLMFLMNHFITGSAAFTSSIRALHASGGLIPCASRCIGA